MIYHWLNNPTQAFSYRSLYVWYNCTIDWLQYIINITPIITVSAFRNKYRVVYFASLSFSIFLNSKTNVVMNLNPFSSVNKSFSLFLIEDWRKTGRGGLFGLPSWKGLGHNIVKSWQLLKMESWNSSLGLKSQQWQIIHALLLLLLVTSILSLN